MFKIAYGAKIAPVHTKNTCYFYFGTKLPKFALIKPKNIFSKTIYCV